MYMYMYAHHMLNSPPEGDSECLRRSCTWAQSLSSQTLRGICIIEEVTGGKRPWRRERRSGSSNTCMQEIEWTGERGEEYKYMYM